MNWFNPDRKTKPEPSPIERCALPLVEAPADLWRAIEAAMEAPRPSRAPAWRWAAAAAALAVCGVGLWYASRTGGDWVQNGTVTLGSIGRMDVQPNSRVRLLRQSPQEIRVELAYGAIDVNVTAPPRLFFVETPSATAVDLGCAYKLRTDEQGNGLLEVTAGWVSLEREGRESMVPAGASCRMRERRGPGTPFFSDASPALRVALDRFDADGSEVDTLLKEARPRDTLTLWHLVPLVDAGVRARVVDRVIELVPLPGGVAREKILALDRDTLTRWREELAWSW